MNSLGSQEPLGTNPTPNRGRNRQRRTRRWASAVSRTVRPTWPDGPPDPNPNQQSLCTISSLSKLRGGRSAYSTWTIRDLVREHVFTPTRSATDRRTVRHLVCHSDRTIRSINSDGPPLPAQHPCTHSCTTNPCTLCPVLIP